MPEQTNLQSSGSGRDPVAASCERANKYSRCRRGAKVIYQLSDLCAMTARWGYIIQKSIYYSVAHFH